MAREAALGLDAVHTAGIIHRDIKLSNIWLEAPNGRVKLIDFGIARGLDPTAGAARPMSAGALMGTTSYMSPEQARGDNVDARTDLWSLGVVLYRLCTDRMPFTGADENITLANITTATPTPPRRHNPQLPEAVEAIIIKLLAKNPDERFQTAADVADALMRAASAVAPTVSPALASSPHGEKVLEPTRIAQPPGKVEPPFSTRRVFASALFVVLVVVMVVRLAGGLADTTDVVLLMFALALLTGPVRELVSGALWRPKGSS